MLTPLSSINLLWVFIAFIANMAVGSYWYSEKGFGQQWMELMKITPETMKKNSPAPAMILVAVTSFLTALAMAAVFALVDVRSVPQGIVVAVLLWLFPVLGQVSRGVFEGKPRQLTAINVSFDLVTYLLMGIILAMGR